MGKFHCFRAIDLPSYQGFLKFGLKPLILLNKISYKQFGDLRLRVETNRAGKIGNYKIHNRIRYHNDGHDWQ